MPIGPYAHSRAQRLEIADQLATQLKEFYGAELIGLGLYGSLARGSDGPYSDIEMFCVLAGQGIDTAFEWTTGPWKAEVDVNSMDTLFEWARTVEGDWPLTHSAFLNVKALLDPDGIFPRLKQIVEAITEEQIQAAMHELIVGDIYELVGKLRNNQARREHASTAVFLVELCLCAAFLAGFANRYFFCSKATMLSESQALSDLPDGHSELCQVVISGDLAIPDRCYAACERYWRGVQTWLAAHSISLIQQLDMILED